MVQVMSLLANQKHCLCLEIWSFNKAFSQMRNFLAIVFWYLTQIHIAKHIFLGKENAYHIVFMLNFVNYMKIYGIV